MNYQKIAQIRTSNDFSKALEQSGIELPFDEELLAGPDSPLGKPYTLKDGFKIGNRFCAHPMEGWDAKTDGRPSELTFRRWVHFGQSGAKLIWGGEAVAVRPDGRANPNQLIINEHTLPDLTKLRQALLEAHFERFGKCEDILVGLQLTHSGRFSKPNRKDLLEPVIAYHHPYLDRKFKIPADFPIISDAELEVLIQDYVRAALLANQAGFDFVDLKHCHGYLGHELLSAYTRPGPFGGSFENRTRFLKLMTERIRKEIPALRIGVRLSAFDSLPFEPDPQTRLGRPATDVEYPYAFGASKQNALHVDLRETRQFLDLLCQLNIELVNLTAGSPYYNPHIQRPAYFPPSDGYLPPENPLAGVARQIWAAADLKAYKPELLMVGTGFSYLQEWLPHVAQNLLRRNQIDFIGLGRMLLSYPDYPADILAGRPIERKRLCRTFSDCTTAPRQGLISGCYPLDPFYKSLPEAETLSLLKKA